MKHIIKRHRPLLLGSVLCVLASSLFATILQFFKGSVLDSAAAGNGAEALRSLLLLIGSILLETGLFYLYRRLSARFTAVCTGELKASVFAAILERDYMSFRTRKLGEYLAKYTNEIDLLRGRCLSMLPLLAEILLKVLLVSAALFFLDWRLALVTLFLLTTPLYLPKLIEGRLQRSQQACVEAVERNLTLVNDYLAGFEVIKQYSIERQILSRFRSSNDHTVEAMLQEGRLGALSQLLTTLISYLSYFVILTCSALLVLRGTFSAGDFFVAIGMIDQLSWPLIALSDVIRQLVAARPTRDAMEEFLLPSPAPQGERGGPDTLEREIRYEDVAFAFTQAQPLLRQFSLTLKKGGRYLLRGPSGCGKTTALNLLLGYYRPQAGRITVDGVPIEHLGGTRRLFTVVRQDTFLFQNTLRSNLTLYQPVEDQILLDALHQLGLDKLASPQALDQVISEGGGNLSGGEKRRICLARAPLRNTPVLLLDEPLANLDLPSARLVEELLLSIRGRTLLVVSHQFSSKKLSAFDQVVDFSPPSKEKGRLPPGGGALFSAQPLQFKSGVSTNPPKTFPVLPPIFGAFFPFSLAILV